jgi:hypothetical protein
MDNETISVCQLHAKMRKDYGDIPFWPYSLTLELVMKGKSDKAIDEEYRKLARESHGDLKD